MVRSIMLIAFVSCFAKIVPTTASCGLDLQAVVFAEFIGRKSRLFLDMGTKSAGPFQPLGIFFPLRGFPD
tara:strand:+ start:449 stop:658 length:210 start_codon:yes stop_codon:yes gene_type:complete